MLAPRQNLDTIQLGNICTLNDAAQRLGRPVTTLRRWAERRTETRFPHPIYADGDRIHIYDYSEIARWVDLWTSTRRRST